MEAIRAGDFVSASVLEAKQEPYYFSRAAGKNILVSVHGLSSRTWGFIFVTVKEN
jgi:hypothetical protein